MSMIRLAGIVNESYVDGKGIRYAIFVQGCKHKCKECQNPETWNFDGGKLVDIDEIVKEIKQNPLLDGVTLSGGDPFYQIEPCLELVQKIKSETNLNIWCYTGFTYEELMKNDDSKELLSFIDVIVDGEYQCDKRDLTLEFRGSSNQRIIDIKKSLIKNKIVLLDIKD